MLRIRNISNQYQKRTLRVVYGQTQAYPYAAVLDPSLRNVDGSFRKPLAADSSPVARSADAFTLQNGLVPGMVVLKAAGEAVVVATGANSASLLPFGFLANFVGGNLDELGDENSVGVWRGQGSVYEVLAPAFDDTGLATAYSSATPGNPVLLYAGTDGRLVTLGSPASRVAVARLIERTSAAKILIESLV